MSILRSADGALDDFSDLKKLKKSKGKKSKFDMEAFERELAATEAADANKDAEDDADGDVPDGKDLDEDVPEGEVCASILWLPDLILIRSQTLESVCQRRRCH